MLEGEVLPPLADSDGDQRPQGAGERRSGSRANKSASVWNIRSALLIVLAVVLVLGTGGIITGWILYDRMAEPDRSTPGVAVRQYLEATLDRRDPGAAKALACGGSTDFAEVDAMLADLKEREQRFSIRITVAWDDIQATTNGANSTVSTTLRVQVPESTGAISESLQRWQFQTRDESGWHVCSAHRIG